MTVWSRPTVNQQATNDSNRWIAKFNAENVLCSGTLRRKTGSHAILRPSVLSGFVTRDQTGVKFCDKSLSLVLVPAVCS